MDQAMADGGAEVFPALEVLAVDETALHVDPAPGFQHPVELLEIRDGVVQMLDDLHHVDAVDALVGDVAELQLRVLVDVQAFDSPCSKEATVLPVAAPEVHDSLDLEGRLVSEVRQPCTVHFRGMSALASLILGDKDPGIDRRGEDGAACCACVIGVFLPGDRVMRKAAANRARRTVGAGGFPYCHALQDGKVFLRLRMVWLDGQHPVVEVSCVVEPITRGADVPDPQQRLDVIRLECQGLVVERERTFDIPRFREVRVGKVPHKPERFGGNLDGTIEMEESFFRLLQKAIQVPQIVVGRGVIRAGRQQCFEQVNRPVRASSSRQAAGLADEGFGVALSGFFRPGLQGVEHRSCQVVRGVDLQDPQVILPRLAELAGFRPDVPQDQKGFRVPRVEGQGLLVMAEGLNRLLHHHVEEIGQIFSKHGVLGSQGDGLLITGKRLVPVAGLIEKDSEIIMRRCIVRPGFDKPLKGRNGLGAFPRCDERSEDARVGFGGGILFASAYRIERPSGCFEIAPAEPCVGFQMVAFPPLVPCIEEHEILLRTGRLERLERRPQPSLVELGSGVDENRGTSLPSGRVVPSWRDAWESLIGRCGFVHHALSDIAVSVDSAIFVGQVMHGRSDLCPVRLKLDGGIEARCRRIRVFIRKTFDPAQIQLADAEPAGLFSPDPGRFRRIGHAVGPINQKERLPVDADITRVAEVFRQVSDVITIVLLAVLLFHQDLVITPVPSSGPIFICPAEAEGEVGLA
ncbi:MAG: hypothetical protein A4E73_00108 [Syntrophaceae bacterium PtaU1.Bin231]|nr:MAG: hypothetical protein A4E73_00108 [Syntrophaceae bacterium PtaU1.Bin231]